MSDMIQCEACSGRGTVGWKLCFSCNGNGKFHPPNHACPQCGGMVVIYGGGSRCAGIHCSWECGLRSPEPAWWHDGTKVYMDGNAWCATRSDFINLQKSPAGFGMSPQEAVDDLVRRTKEIGETDRTHALDAAKFGGAT